MRLRDRLAPTSKRSPRLRSNTRPAIRGLSFARKYSNNYDIYIYRSLSFSTFSAVFYRLASTGDYPETILLMADIAAPCSPAQVSDTRSWKFNDFRVITRPGDDSRWNATEQRVR